MKIEKFEEYIDNICKSCFLSKKNVCNKKIIRKIDNTIICVEEDKNIENEYKK